MKDQVLSLPLSKIDVGVTEVDANEVSTITNILETRGQVKPITVRPSGNDRYITISGAPWWHACKALFGDNGMIDAIVRSAAEEQASSMEGRAFVSLRIGDVVPGKNPRTYFDPAKMRDLMAQIETQSQLQPITVRQVGDKYGIIAGERRWRAMKALYGENGMIDAIVRVVSDEEAETMALVENIGRADMSPVEEAAGAQRLLDRLKDKVEVANQLGWTFATLERRLALLRCTPEVQQQLTEGKIKLGHAELLAALAKEKQNGVLQRILDAGMSVEQLRKAMSEIAQKLDKAIFDRADCMTCQHNSGCQAALFSETIGDGSCTHPTCFQTKTADHLHSIKEELEKETQRVEALNPGDDSIIAIKLVPAGERGVGEEQMQACRSCANFGATISKSPDSMGCVERDICFDPACNTMKVADQIKATQAKRQQTKNAATTSNTSGAEPAGSTSTVRESLTSTSSQTKPVASAIRQAIKDYSEKIWRQFAAKTLLGDDLKALSVLMWLGISGNARCIMSTKVNEKIKQYCQLEFSATSELMEVMTKVDALSSDARAQVIRIIVACAMLELEITKVRKVLEYLQVDLSTQWKFDAGYLKMLTKAEIEAITAECGLKAHLNDEDWKKLFAGSKKHDEIVAAVMQHAEGALLGKLPKHLNY